MDPKPMVMMRELHLKNKTMYKKNITEIKKLAGDLNCMGTYGLIELELTELENKIKRLTLEKDYAIEALNNIATPMEYLQKEAEKDGATLNGFIAVQLTLDSNFYKEIATKTLNTIKQNNE